MIPSLYYSQVVVVAEGYASDYYGEYVEGSAEVVGNAIIIDGSGSIPVSVGSRQLVEITCNQDVQDLTLEFIAEAVQGSDVASVVDAAITKDGTTATLSLTSAMTTVERTLRWSLVNTANGEAVAAGLMFVTYDAQGDS